MKFNAKQTVDKIYSLASKQGIKIGDLEEKCGLSKGYLSRLSKSENTAPSIEVLLNIAEQLGTTLNFLLSPDISILTESDREVLAFMNKLIDYTEKGKLKWVTDKYESLIFSDWSPLKIDHPLIKSDSFDFDDNNNGYYSSYYESHFLDGRVNIADDCFHVDLPATNSTAYLMSVEEFFGNNSEERKAFELYIGSKDKAKGLCCSKDVPAPVKEKITELYRTVKSKKSNVFMDKEIKSLISDFMGLHELGE